MGIAKRACTGTSEEGVNSLGEIMVIWSRVKREK